MKTIVISEEDGGRRLDSVLAERLPEQTRSRWQKLIGKGYITSDNIPLKAKATLKAGTKLAIDVPELKIKPVDIDVIYEDDDVIVINKPSGLLSHSKGAFNDEFTVADFFKEQTSDTAKDRPGIVHRLDRATSGVMIGAKTLESKKFLQKEFSTRKVEKVYVAVGEGVFNKDHVILDWPIDRNPKQPSKFRVHANGKAAQTDIRKLNSGDKWVAFELRPRTGRTHQIRVHLAKLGNPIIGDVHYGAKTDLKGRVLLHARKLTTKLPSGETKSFVAPVPQDMKKYL